MPGYCRASFTDYNKATWVRKFYTAYTGVLETNYLTQVRYTSHIAQGFLELSNVSLSRSLSLNIHSPMNVNNITT